MKDLIHNLSPHLFWDINRDTIDPQAHRRYIINRILSRGTIIDFKALLAFYDVEVIKEEIKKLVLWIIKQLTLQLSIFPFQNKKCDAIPGNNLSKGTGITEPPNQTVIPGFIPKSSINSGTMDEGGEQIK